MGVDESDLELTRDRIVEIEREQLEIAVSRLEHHGDLTADSRALLTELAAEMVQSIGPLAMYIERSKQKTASDAGRDRTVGFVGDLRTNSVDE